jgi:hypothetical protein
MECDVLEERPGESQTRAVSSKGGDAEFPDMGEVP